MLEMNLFNISVTVIVCSFISVNSKLIEDVIKFRLSWSWLPKWFKDSNPDNPRDWWHIASWFNFIHWIWTSVYWIGVYLGHGWIVIIGANILITIFLMLYFQFMYHYGLMKPEHRDLKDRGWFK